jgi:hypothetical protein
MVSNAHRVPAKLVAPGGGRLSNRVPAQRERDRSCEMGAFSWAGLSRCCRWLGFLAPANRYGSATITASAPLLLEAWALAGTSSPASRSATAGCPGWPSCLGGLGAS